MIKDQGGRGAVLRGSCDTCGNLLAPFLAATAANHMQSLGGIFKDLDTSRWVRRLEKSDFFNIRPDAAVSCVLVSETYLSLRSTAGHGLLILEVRDHTKRRVKVGRTPLEE
jgi:hypothetical protein